MLNSLQLSLAFVEKNYEILDEEEITAEPETPEILNNS